MIPPFLRGSILHKKLFPLFEGFSAVKYQRKETQAAAWG